MKISYFVHDIGHLDVPRRVAMLREGGAETTVFGFHRTQAVDVDGAAVVVDLGRTIDAHFMQRIWAVASAVPRLRQWAREIASSRVILARNLEMLLLAAIARRLYAPQAALVYECLDIHRLMLSKGVAGAALRQLERRLLARCQGLIVSSPAFLREYFDRAHRVLPKAFVVENKVFLTGGQMARGGQTAGLGPPWKIGWFGMLRCRRSLDILSRLVQSAPHLVEVVVAGIFAPGIFGDVQTVLDSNPGLTYVGPYKGEAEASRLFRSVHFTWTLDFYEAGGNSNWLLPNRLYRAALYGSVPLASTDVETGKWLASHGAGILLDEPLQERLLAAMLGMTPPSLLKMEAAVERIPVSALVTQNAECRDLIRSLRELACSAH